MDKTGPARKFPCCFSCQSSADCGRIWSCCHRYLPSAKLDWHEENTCSRLAVLQHSVQLGLSASPQEWRFYGVGRTSYTEHIRNLIWWSSMVQMSCQVRAFTLTLSHLVQPSCCFMATALKCRCSSSAFQTSLCTIPHLSFGSVLHQLVLEMHLGPSLL